MHEEGGNKGLREKIKCTEAKGEQLGSRGKKGAASAKVK